MKWHGKRKKFRFFEMFFAEKALLKAGKASIMNCEKQLIFLRERGENWDV